MARRPPIHPLHLIRERGAQAARAASEVFAHKDLRNLQLSLVLNWTGEFGFLVALGVFAYEEGGSLAVGLLGLGRLLPAGVVALLGSAAADRYRREAVLRAVYLVRASLAAVVAIAFFGDAPPAFVYVFGALVTIASAALRPAFWALVPGLARTPTQLTAANVLASTSEGVALLAGPALGGIALAAFGAGWVFAGGGVLFGCSAIFAFTIRSGVRPSPRERHVIAETIEGVRAVIHEPATRMLVALGGAQTFVRGALLVLMVVAALELLDMGEAGVGFLNSAFGVGNLVGAVAALALVGRRRLGGPLIVGLLLWGLPITLVGVWVHPVAALLLLTLPGWGNAIFDVAILTMLQRSTDDRVLGRVFGLLETAVFASMALGSIAASGLLAVFSVRVSLIITGTFLPVVAALAWRSIRRIDDSTVVPDEEIALLRRVSIFGALPAVALEHIAHKLEPVRVAAGTTIFREGERGDRFYVIDRGRVTISAGGQVRAELGEADYFGEIALIRGIPRTATVTALEDTALYALGPTDFLEATSRYERCARITEEEIDARLHPDPGSRPPTDG